MVALETFELHVLMRFAGGTPKYMAFGRRYCLKIPDLTIIILIYNIIAQTTCWFVQVEGTLMNGEVHVDRLNDLQQRIVAAYSSHVLFVVES